MFQCQLVVQATNRLIIQALRRGETFAQRAELAQYPCARCATRVPPMILLSNLEFERQFRQF